MSLVAISNFSGPAGSSLAEYSGQLGGTWSVPLGGYVLTAAGQARLAVAANGLAVNLTVPGNAGYSHGLDWICASITAGLNVGAGVRWDATGQNGYVGFYVDGFGWCIYKCVGGALTRIDTGGTAFQVTAGNYYHQELQVRGNQLTLLAGGQIVATATDSTFTSAGYPAVYCYQSNGASDSTGIQLDNSVVNTSTDVGSPTTQIVAVGDSREYGAGSTCPGASQAPSTSYLSLAIQSLGAGYVGRNQGIYGQRLDEMHARATVWKEFVSTSYARNIVVLGDAINSLAQGRTAEQALNDMQTLIADAQSVGADYRVVTTLPTSTSSTVPLGDYNALLRANVPMAKLVDFQGEPRIGSDSAPNGSNYSSDHVHLSDAGQAIQAQILAASLASAAPVVISPTAPGRRMIGLSLGI